MNNEIALSQLVQEVECALAERRHLRARGVHLIVTHLHHIPGTLCAPGEIIGDISIGGLPEPVSLGLSHKSLLLTDCFCRYRLPLTALRIEEIMNTDPFYLAYGSNRIGRSQTLARPDRNDVRVYIPRVRRRMEDLFRKIGLNVDSDQIVASEATETNVATYRLKATVEFVHLGITRKTNVGKHHGC